MNDESVWPEYLAAELDRLVVEYKGGHLYTDAEEKRIIGELWEKRSQGKCLFVMPTERKFELIRGKVK